MPDFADDVVGRIDDADWPPFARRTCGCGGRSRTCSRYASGRDCELGDTTDAPLSH
ncbi:hypothetical protein [Nonomuraea rosea]|uniref:hypothetical protein n=1 Tax=Nonomuraea rosea TaxID=638574 RepID=UPI0031E4FC3A